MNNRKIYETAFDMISNCDSYLFVADINTKLYHTSRCEELHLIPIINAHGCGKYPERAGFNPCPKCCPERAAALIESPLYMQIAMGKYRKLSRTEVIKLQLQDLCELYGLHIEFHGSIAYVTTIAGEWFFDAFSCPIRLHHKNENLWLRMGYKPKGFYHLQNIQISSPLYAIAYIYRHEKAAVRRVMENDAEDPS